MRRLAAAVFLAALSAFGTSGSAAAAIPISSAKVVIVVGATEGTTSTYRSYADQAYAEAIKYTSKVTKVYSPNATWAKVKAAVAGANIVLYYGHGNGWPSPYTYDPAYSTKDGMGLNDPAHLSDSVHKYYGEPSMATLGLAPNAIVLLGNLCYASGNSEPGQAGPTVTVARQRIDNYAAGFIKGGARAVIADGHGGLVSYIRGLFTTGQTIVNLWRTVPNYHGHESSFASSRSPGYTAYSDPDTTSGGYYRSLVTKPTITTTAVTNAVGDTGVDPAALVVPGRAEVDEPGTPILASASLAELAAADDPALDLPVGTRLKVLAIGLAGTATTPALVQVQGLDDPAITGYVPADHLAPKDSRAPVLIGIDSGAGRLSPNGDGVADTVTVNLLFSESVAWTFDVRSAGGTVVDTLTGTGREAAATWTGLAGGDAVADGTYTWSVRGTDPWQYDSAPGTGSVVVDTAAPSITSVTPAGGASTTFTPNGDGASDTVSTSAVSSEGGSLLVRVADASDTTVRTFSVAASAGVATTFTWDGRNTAGAAVPDGPYTMTIVPRDAAGNSGDGATRQVLAVGILGYLTNSTKVFDPQDLDRFSKTMTLSFRLNRPATVTWTLRNAAGLVVLTHLDAAPQGPGNHGWVFDGRSATGSMLPAGVYSATVSATDGTYTIASSSKVEMNAFSITTSVTTAKRGSSLTVTAVTAESLQGSPRIYVTEPGIATWGVTMTKVNSTTWRATLTMKKGGAAGTVKFKVWGRDADGRSQATWKTLPLS